MAKKTKNNKRHQNNNSFNGLKIYKVNGEKKERNARRMKALQIVLLIVLVIGGLAAVFVLLRPYAQSLFGKSSLSGELAASVDSHPMTMAELDAEYSRLPLQYQQIVTKEYFLSQMIDEYLVIKKGTELGLIVTDEEVDANINDFMTANNLTREQLDELLKARNLDYEGLRNLVKSQLLIEKVVAQEVTSKVSVKTEDALKYYNDNSEQFKVPELVTVKHILIGTQDGTADKDAEAKANQILSELKKDISKFCGYVSTDSADSGSVAKCGEYTFPRGQMVAEFEDRAFSQNVGELSIVKTDYGYHIIWTVNKTPDSLILFKDIQAEINQLLETQQEKALYSEFVAGLRANAKIINYLEQKKEADAGIVVENEAVSGSETKVTITQPAQEEAQATAEEKIVEDEKLAEEQEEVAEAVEETPTIEETEPVETEAVESESTTSISMPKDYAACFASKGLTLYGASWDSSTKKQQEALGTYLSSVQYVECGVQGDYRAQTDECKTASIEAYPTWDVAGKKYMGIYSSDEIAAIAGC